jgi:hypothetical protein
MSAGYPIVGTDINNQAGRLVVAAWQSLNDIRQFKLWLDDAVHTDAFLNTAGITGSASTGDVKLLRDSFADLGGASGLWAVSHGTFAPAGASNYFTNAKNLAGLNYAG